MEFISKLFPLSTILLMYRIGSKAYGVATSNSDNDIVVVLDGYSGMDHITDYETMTEYFIYSKDFWIEKMELSPRLANLFLIFPDEVLGNIPLYIKDDFVSTYESYQNRDFATIFKTYLGKVIDYFETYLNDDRQIKTMWHLYRIEEQVLRYMATREWSLDLAPATIERIQVYKGNYQLQSEHSLNEFKNIIEYLKEVKNHD